MVLTAVIGSADVSAAAARGDDPGTYVVKSWTDGLVITFASISVAKTLEVELRGQQASLEKWVVEQSAKLDRIREHQP